MDGATSRVPALHRAAAILRVIGASDQPLSLSDIARSIGSPKSSTLGVCRGLVVERLLARGSDGRYWLGPRTAEFAATAHASLPPVRRIGMTVPSIANDFYVAEMRAAREEAAAYGVELLVEAAGYDVPAQRAQVLRYIEDDVDLIVVDPIDSDAIEHELEQARRAGIPIVAVNANATGADLAITTDNTLAGALAARYLGAALGPGATIAIIDGSPVTAIADRVQGFREALRDFPELHIVAYGRGDNQRQTGARVAREILGDHPLVDAFFGVNDPTSLGIFEACEELGSRAAIVSVDGSGQFADLVRAGGRLMSTSTQDPVELVRSAFRLGNALCAGFRPTQGTITLASALVSRDNVKDYVPW